MYILKIKISPLKSLKKAKFSNLFLKSPYHDDQNCHKLKISNSQFVKDYFFMYIHRKYQIGIYYFNFYVKKVYKKPEIKTATNYTPPTIPVCMVDKKIKNCLKKLYTSNKNNKKHKTSQNYCIIQITKGKKLKITQKYILVLIKQ